MSKSTAPTGWGVWTWPNLVTAVRLAGIPLFCYLLLATEYYWQAAIVLAVGGGTDWVDGQLARRLNQVSKLGRLLDPFVDRLYILTALLALTYAGLLPWLFTVAVLLREATLVSLVIVLRWHGFAPPQVHFLGKSATTVVFMSFPVLVVAGLVDSAAVWAAPLGWALAWWGLGLYWLAALVYLRQAVALLRVRRSRTHLTVLLRRGGSERMPLGAIRSVLSRNRGPAVRTAVVGDTVMGVRPAARRASQRGAPGDSGAVALHRGA